MYYEINVSLDGKHFFCTAERSCVTAEKTAKLVSDFANRFPMKDGFKIMVTRYVTKGNAVLIDATKSDKFILKCIESLSESNS